MTYNLNLYTKAQGWTKQEVIVEAETLEEAIKLVKEGDCNYGEWNYLFETEDSLKYELENEDGDLLSSWE